MRLVPVLAAALFWLAPSLAVAQQVELVMVEQHGCVYCLQWDRDVAPEYPLTAEGATAPLRRVDIDDVPEDLDLASRPVLTPTFILVRDGRELSRLEGYPGEEFFWPLLNRMILQAGIPLAEREETGS
jgi:thioredoxin-related protein